MKKSASPTQTACWPSAAISSWLPSPAHWLICSPNLMSGQPNSETRCEQKSKRWLDCSQAAPSGKVEAEVDSECENKWRVYPEYPTGQADGQASCTHPLRRRAFSFFEREYA